MESPTRYDPFANPQNALHRRGQVLHAMAEHGYISWATERKAVKAPLGLHRSYVPLQTGCSGAKIKNAAFFCDYVMSQILNNPAYEKAKQQMLTVGGLKIYTTLSAKDQRAATNAVNYVVPPKKPYYNPGYNVDTEVMVQPGTGYVKAIAVDRPYGFGPGQTSVDYAVDTKYDGGAGVQTGSSSKLFTLITALKQGLQFGFNLKVHDNMTVGGFSDCHGNYVQPVHRQQCRRQRGRQDTAVLRHHGVDQRVLRGPRVEGRPVQRGQDGRQHGPAPRRRFVVAEDVGKTVSELRPPMAWPRSRSARSMCRRCRWPRRMRPSRPAASTAARSRS